MTVLYWSLHDSLQLIVFTVHNLVETKLSRCAVRDCDVVMVICNCN